MPTALLKSLIPSRYRPYEFLCREAWRATHGTVAAGPFRGMEYVPVAANSALVPKLLGTYEHELIDVVEAITRLAPATIIDVGCAEGYYTVGLARRCPDATVIAFDRDGRARTLAVQLATLNGVASRVEIRGACMPADLQAALKPHSVVVCDVEGFEYDLLDPERVPLLGTAWMLVEVHDTLVPGVGDTLTRRFAPTHEVTRIAARPRTADDCPPFHPLLRVMPKSTIVSLIIERPHWANMYWLWIAPRAVSESA